MRLKSIELYNYGPFKGLNKIEFKDTADVIFICGEYSENKLRSNRAGKSSFVEGVLYLLYGQTRDKEVNLIHNNEAEMYVAGTVTINGKDVYIKRGRIRDGNKPILEIEGIKGKKSEKEKELASTLGITYNDFINSFYFKQGDIHQFMKASPTEKKKLLQSWFNLQAWNEYETKAKAKFALKQQEVTKQQAIIESKISSHSTMLIPEIQHINSDIAKYKAELDDINNQITQLNVELSKTSDPTDLKKSLDGLRLQLLNCNNDVNTVITNISKLESSKVSAESNCKKAEEVKNTLTQSSATILNNLNEHKIKFTEIQTNIANLQKVYQEKKSLCDKLSTFNGVCPVDSNACDKGSRVSDYKVNLETEITSIVTKANNLVNQTKELNPVILEFTNLYNQTVTNENLVVQLSKVQPSSFDEQINLLKASLQTSNNNRKLLEEQILKLDDEFKLLNPTIRNNLTVQLNAKKLKQVEVSELIKNLNIQLGSIAQLEKDKEKLSLEINGLQEDISNKKKELYRLGYVVSMFGKDGVPSILIENSLSYIEEFANILLESVSTGFKVEFSTTKEVTTKEIHCSICGSPFSASDKKCTVCGLGFKRNKIKDEVDLKIYNGTYERNFDLDSGGGQILISLCLRLALAKLIINKHTPCQLLILDEILGQLDAVNRDLVCKLVFNNIKSLLGISQIFVISHTAVQDYPYQNIKIVRNDIENFSRIVLDS